MAETPAGLARRSQSSASVADIMAELYIRNKIDEELRQLDNEQVLEHEEVQQRMQQWRS
jgi:hypothetical protein